MKITLLGTGTSQGVPVIGCSCTACTSVDSKDKRLRSSVLIQSSKQNILIDTSPDLRAQMLAHNVNNIDAVLYTHEHNDHIIGLDDIRPFNFRSKNDMPLYGQKRVLDDLQHRFAYVFAPSAYPGTPKAITYPILPFEKIVIGDISITALAVMHGTLPILGYRIGDFAFITDASYLEDRTMSELEGLDYLVLNALQRDRHHSHFNIEQALQVIHKLKPKKSFLTHISHRMGPVQTWDSELPPNVYVAYDGLKLEIQY